jgi:predicted metalloprotease with PDZ domain
VGVTEGGIEALAGRVSGIDLSEFFSMALYSTTDLPLASLFESVGVRLNWRPRSGPSDKGGKAANGAKGPSSWLGARLAPGATEPRLSQVYDAGPAQSAGLSAGDVVVALDGLRVTARDLEERIGRLAPGSELRCHAFRDDALMEFTLTLAAPPQDTCFLELDPDASPQAQRARSAWLHSDSQ